MTGVRSDEAVRSRVRVRVPAPVPDLMVWFIIRGALGSYLRTNTDHLAHQKLAVTQSGQLAGEVRIRARAHGVRHYNVSVVHHDVMTHCWDRVLTSEVVTVPAVHSRDVVTLDVNRAMRPTSEPAGVK
jgi:hypothetical protein